MVERVKRKILLSNEELRQRANDAACWIEERYRGKNALLVPVMMGALPTAAAIVENLENLEDFQMDSVRVQSYTEQESNKKPKIVQDLMTDVKDRHVVIIEDIIDTGHTLKFLKEELTRRGAASVAIVAMLDKYERREVDIEADFVGFRIPNVWVEGFGLDTDGYFRGGPNVTFRD